MVCQKAESIKISFAFRQHLIIAACYVSKMYKRTAVGLYGKPYNTKPVGGASCPAEQHQVQVKPNTSSAWYWKPLRLFQWSTKKARWSKSSTAFLQRLIDTVCNPAQMYKVELKDGVSSTSDTIKALSMRLAWEILVLTNDSYLE